MSVCHLHGAHEGDCHVCSALVSVKAARALIEAWRDGSEELSFERVVALHGAAIEALEKVRPWRRDSREERWK